MTHALIFWLLLALSPLCKAFVSHLSTIFSKEQTIVRESIVGPSSRAMNKMVDADAIVDRAQLMDNRAKEGIPLTKSELDGIIDSIRNICPSDVSLDDKALRELLSEVGHLSHKDWLITGKNSEALAKVLLPDGMSAGARQMFRRVVSEGNWDGAEQHFMDKVKDDQPSWAVLVTGVNGIRKTTSIYQPWFPALLAEALVAPSGAAMNFDERVLPSGQTAFFRQLDHMIATICNEEFKELYRLTGLTMVEDQDPPQNIVNRYSNLKASIFTRYRTFSELVGVMLLREAQKLSLNCMMETSGRDVAMFTYIDAFFPSSYKKLALHFTINDLTCAQESVDKRMIEEMKRGIEALKMQDVLQIIDANAGGPYGSEVLPDVQEASDRVWNEIIMKNDGVGEDWYKATIKINAHSVDPWTAQAVRPDGTLGTKYVFRERK